MGIMEKEIKIANLISTDVRSRSNADIIRNELLKDTSRKITLDFCGVTFVSRSFTDELYSIIEYSKKTKIEVVNTSGVVEKMLNAVKNSRINKRVRLKDDSEIKEFKDIDSLSIFLSHW